MKGPGSAASLKARALRSLARREYSRAELAAKLLRAERAAVVAEAAARAEAAAPADADVDAAAAAGDPASPDPAALDPARFDRGEIEAGLRSRVDAVLDQLAGVGLLDDERAAEALVAAKAPRYGARRLQQMLQAKGLSAGAGAAALAAASGSETERARAVWRRRYAAPPADAREYARQSRFLAARGFAGDVIRQLLRGEADDDA